MFEKEAEEYREKWKNEGYYLVSQEMEQEELDYIIDESFKDGAELGYNKAKKELAERLDEAKEMLEQFIKFSMFPLTTKKDIEDVQILLKSASQFCKEME